MGYNSGKVEATLNLSESTKKTVSPASGTAAGVQTTTLGTVPAGKKWTILTMNITSIGAGAAAGTGLLKLNAVEWLACGSYSSATGNMANSAAQRWSYESAPTLAEGLAVTIVGNNAAVSSYANISYVEEVA